MDNATADMGAVATSLAAIAAGAAISAAAPAGSRSIGSSETDLTRCISIASGGRTWLERTLWGLRDQEGGRIGAEIANADGSHDLGPLQINSWWIPKLAAVTRTPPQHVRWWLIHDPCFNVNSARWIFLGGLAVTHDYWKAIGAYHSPLERRQQRYTASVASKLSRRFGRNIFAVRSRRVTPAAASREESARRPSAYFPAKGALEIF
ncbi:lytic transglycosylase domain-containing protein [Sphingomonas sp. BIUV-7]|uniref:Lytic transglycosylase domain-containing protein n=1 Tax=Sphingomonas natans TaxID=3063330 RepID=A0ABT8YAJ6_9SPHN|nr:lytic transglycosylase domain-containing protein [Sphingomonas sp. BIUV-7]MDO6415340.1 lytic transglycosylase domain-containing protein [Sphingomonas sp. BIUV-7]